METITEKTKVFKGILSQTTVVVISGALGFINFAIMSRLLTKETFGFFAIISAAMVVINEINSAGMGSAVIQRKNLDNSFFSTAFSLSFITGTFFSLLVFLLSPVLSDFFVHSTRLEVPFKVVSITLLLNNICSVLRAQYMRKLQFLRFGAYQIIVSVLSYGLGITMAINGSQLAAIIAASVSNSILLTIILVWLNRNDLCFKIEKKYIKDILSYGGWLTASGVVRSIYEQIDKLLTTKWLSVVSLGAYNRPNGFVFQISSTVNGIFDTTLFPILSSIKDDKDKIHSAYEKSVELTCVFSCLMSFTMILGAHILTFIFLGKQWLNLIPIFQIASFTIIFLFYGRIGDSFFRSTGYVRDYFFVRVAVCTFSILCVYLGCKFDIVGLAIGVLVSRIFDVLIKMWVLGKRIGIKQFPIIKKVLIDIMIPSLCFVLCFILTLCSDYEYISEIALVLYVMIFVIVLIYKPLLLGEIFFESIYSPISAKIGNRIYKKR